MMWRPTMIAILAAATLSGCKPNNREPIDFLVAPIKAGGDIKLSTEYKGKPVLVYLWATWCGPCKAFAPTLNSIAAVYKPKGIAFLAISHEAKKVVEESEIKEPHDMTVLLDSYGSATEALGSNSLPTILILDKEHRPVWGSKGIGETTEAEIRKTLDGLT